jgi:tetratricopeptide (TPR) repeat protein
MLAAPALAQRKISVLHGELISELPSASLGNLLVEMSPNGNQFSRERCRVSPEGSFSFQNIDAGSYTLHVLDLHGESVHDEVVTIREGMDLSIFLGQPKAEKPPAGTISAHDLAHPVPPKALKEYVAAKRAAAAGDQDKAIAHFQRAVSIDPEYGEAWNDLGVAFMRKGRTAEAADSFQKAATIQPKMSLIQSNLSIAQSKLGRLNDAEISARRAVELDGQSERARQALALSLALRSRQAAVERALMP